jgi:glycosyltransferase involved in cell wall biosynthesis
VRLSIVIPCFNVANTIATQLEALARQSSSYPWEVVVADNGSTDGTVLITERYKERLPSLRIVDTSARRGAAHARNMGASAARGEALLFCDADDEVAPGWIEAMGRALTQYDFVAGRLDTQYLNADVPPGLLRSPQDKHLQEYRYPAFLPHAAAANLGVKRRIHDAVGGFDETLLKLQDTDYCWKVQLMGTELHFVPEACVYYRLRSTPIESYKQARLWGEYNVMLYKRYRPLGMPKLHWHCSAKVWARMMLRLPYQLSRQETRRQALRDLAWHIGRLQGSLKYRVMAL